jgi:hypothetical protein
VRALAIVFVVAVLVAARAGGAAEEVPDAQLLLDLDLLSQAEPRERDLMRRMSVVERLRLLEIFRFLEARPAVPAERRPPADVGGR